MSPEPVDLVEAFVDLAKLLPEDQDEEPGFLSLGHENLPIPPSALVSNRLCLTRSYHFYNDHPVDKVSIEGDKPTLRALGLAIFAAIFHDHPSEVAIHLEHSRSNICRIVIDRHWTPTPDLPGYISKPFRFNYYPEEVSRHPWPYRFENPWSLPVLQLTTDHGHVDSPSQLESRTVAVGFGPVEGSVLFAELLLNASLEANKELEFELEGEMGFRGVGPGSAEITVWLPGGLGYLDAPVEDASYFRGPTCA